MLAPSRCRLNRLSDIEEAKLLGILRQIASVARAAAAGSLAGSGWVSSIAILPVSYSSSEIQQTLKCVICPCRATEPNELVRLDFNLPDVIPRRNEWQCLLRLEIEPFIMGVGQVRVRDTSKGIVIVGLDERFENSGRPSDHE